MTEIRDDAVIEHVRIRKRHRPRGLRLSLAMTPMIDVVFLLLIYFMVATDFQMGEAAYRIDLPSSEGAADPFSLDEEPLRIMINSTGLGADMYRLRLDGPYQQPHSFDELHQFLASLQVNEENIAMGTGAIFAANHPIMIQPSRSTRWEHAIEALNAAARAKYTNVTFAKPN